MARPREFDLQTAVAAAMDVFWTHGYADASLPDLLKGTGLSRGSLYKAFNGKQPLFIAALRHYEELEVQPMADVLTDTGVADGLARIKAVFMTIPHTVRNGDTRGCLLCSAAAGRAAQEPQIAELIHGLLDGMERSFDTALNAAQISTAGTAQMLVAQYVGLRTLSRAGVEADVLEQSVAALVQTLKAMRS